MTTYNDTLNEVVSSISSITNKTLFINTVDNTITLDFDVPLPHPIITLNNTIDFTYTFSLDHVTKLVESIIFNYVTNDTVITSDSISELIAVIEEAKLAFNNSINDSIYVVESLYVLVKKLELISNVIHLSSDLNSKFLLVNTIHEVLALIASLDKSIKESILDTLILNELIVDLYKVYKIVVESIIAVEELKDSYLYMLTLQDQLVSDSTLVSNIIGTNLLSDELIIAIPTASGNDVYLGYLFSPESRSVSTYTNYNFDGSCVFNGKYLFFNKSGLYEYGAAKDDGAIVRSYIQTAGLTFGTSDLKIVPNIYLGYTSDNIIILKVNVDGKGSITYKLNKGTNNLETKLIEIGKGLMGRYFQFELITEADEFDMESIEFMPIRLQRKL